MSYNVNTALIQIWVDTRQNHLEFCQTLGIIYTDDSLRDQFALLEDLRKTFQLATPAEMQEIEFQKDF